MLKFLLLQNISLKSSFIKACITSGINLFTVSELILPMDFWCNSILCTCSDPQLDGVSTSTECLDAREV